MSFSIKWLFALIALAAIFAAALASQTPLWVAIIFNVTVAILVGAALTGLLSSRLRAFWLCFAVVGWLHLILNSFPFSKHSVSSHLLTRRVAFKIWEHLHGDEYYGITVKNAYPSDNLYYHIQAEDMALYSDTFAYFLDIMQNLFALLLGLVAGVIASYFMRRSSKSAEN